MPGTESMCRIVWNLQLIKKRPRKLDKNFRGALQTLGYFYIINSANFLFSGPVRLRAVLFKYDIFQNKWHLLDGSRKRSYSLSISSAVSPVISSMSFVAYPLTFIPRAMVSRSSARPWAIPSASPSALPFFSAVVSML